MPTRRVKRTRQEYHERHLARMTPGALQGRSETVGPTFRVPGVSAFHGRPSPPPREDGRFDACVPRDFPSVSAAIAAFTSDPAKAEIRICVSESVFAEQDITIPRTWHPRGHIHIEAAGPDVIVAGSQEGDPGHPIRRTWLFQGGAPGVPFLLRRVSLRRIRCGTHLLQAGVPQPDFEATVYIGTDAFGAEGSRRSCVDLDLDESIVGLRMVHAPNAIFPLSRMRRSRVDILPTFDVPFVQLYPRSLLLEVERALGADVEHFANPRWHQAEGDQNHTASAVRLAFLDRDDGPATWRFTTLLYGMYGGLEWQVWGHPSQDWFGRTRFARLDFTIPDAPAAIEILRNHGFRRCAFSRLAAGPASAFEIGGSGLHPVINLEECWTPDQQNIRFFGEDARISIDRLRSLTVSPRPLPTEAPWVMTFVPGTGESVHGDRSLFAIRDSEVYEFQTPTDEPDCPRALHFTNNLVGIDTVPDTRLRAGHLFARDNLFAQDNPPFGGPDFTGFTQSTVGNNLFDVI